MPARNGKRLERDGAAETQLTGGGSSRRSVPPYGSSSRVSLSRDWTDTPSPFAPNALRNISGYQDFALGRGGDAIVIGEPPRITLRVDSVSGWRSATSSNDNWGRSDSGLRQAVSVEPTHSR